MEIAPKPETQKTAQKRSVAKKNYSNITGKLGRLKRQEQQTQIQEFLGHIGIGNSPELRDYLGGLLLDRKEIDPHFSLYDLTKEEISEIKRKGRGKLKENTFLESKEHAKSAEALVDDLKTKGLSNYETLQELLEAHETGQVTLLLKKYADFSAFFQKLKENEYGVKDTKRIIQAINASNVDLTTPNAFEQVIWTIYEDDQISDKTKEKIRQKFKLFPIRTGDDLKENLKIKHQQVQALERQKRNATESLDVLNREYDSLESELSDLKKSILTETDLDKRLALEKHYDKLEEKLKVLEKERQEQKATVKELRKKKVTSKVYLRGAEADLVDGEIVVTIPKTKMSVSVPSHLSSAAIAKVVNAYLLNEVLKSFGLESFFFYQSDFSEGNYPHPLTLDRSDLFLFRLGLASNTQILKPYDLKRIDSWFTQLMRPDEYQVNLTAKDSAKLRMEELKLLHGDNLDFDKMAKQFLEIKRFRKRN